MKRLSEINETHWGGMVRRSSSDVQRKENDIDNMLPDEFYKYCEEKYKNSTFELVYRDNSITIYINGSSIIGAILYRDDNNENIDTLGYFLYSFHNTPTELDNIIENNYKITYLEGCNVSKLTPKEGTFTNKDCIKFLDLIDKNIQ